MSSDKRSELSILRDEWFESEEGKSSRNSFTLGQLQADLFLKNRLERAFIAGYKAGEKLGQHHSGVRE